MDTKFGLLSNKLDAALNDVWVIDNFTVDSEGQAVTGKTCYACWTELTVEQADTITKAYCSKSEDSPILALIGKWSPLQELDRLQRKLDLAAEAVAAQRRIIKNSLLYSEGLDEQLLAELRSRCSLSVRKAKLDSPRAAELRAAIAAELEAISQQKAEEVYEAESNLAAAQLRLSEVLSSPAATQMAFELREELSRLATGEPTEEQITLTVRAAK